MNPDPQIEPARANPNGLSGLHRGPNDNAGTTKLPVGDSCSPSNVFHYVQNAGHLTDKHDDASGHCPNRSPHCRCDSDTAVASTSLTRRGSKAINDDAAHRCNGRNWLGYGKKHSYKMRHNTETHISNVCRASSRWKKSAHASCSKSRTQLQHSLCMNLRNATLGNAQRFANFRQC